jgi:hypothetical protein
MPDGLSWNTEALLVLLLILNIFATMAIAIAFILLARWLLKPQKETLIFGQPEPDQLVLDEKDLGQLFDQEAFSRMDTAPVPFVSRGGQQ